MNATTPPPLPVQTSSLQKGKRLLLGAVICYLLMMLVPWVGKCVHFAEKDEFVNGPYTIALAVPGWEHIAVLPLMAMLWYTLKGSNMCRSLLGTLAVFGVIAAAGPALAVVSGEYRAVSILGLIFFVALCFIVNAFLMNEDVQAYVISLRKARGMSPDHWNFSHKVVATPADVVRRTDPVS